MNIRKSTNTFQTDMYGEDSSFSHRTDNLLEVPASNSSLNVEWERVHLTFCQLL